MITIQRRDMSSSPKQFESKPDLDYENTWRIVREEKPGELYIYEPNASDVQQEWDELRKKHGKVSATIYGHMYNYRMGDIDLHGDRLVSVVPPMFNVIVDGKRKSLRSLTIEVVFSWDGAA